MSEETTKISYIWNGHEDRLQNLEIGRMEISAQIAEQTATLKSIKEDVIELSSSVKATNKSIECIINKFQAHVELDNSRILALEVRERYEMGKTDWIRKVVYGLLVGSGGALISMLVEHFKNH